MCNERGLRYCITAGSLLGAYRHGKSIPWVRLAPVVVAAGTCVDLLATMGGGGASRPLSARQIQDDDLDVVMPSCHEDAFLRAVEECPLLDTGTCLCSTARS